MRAGGTAAGGRLLQDYALVVMIYTGDEAVFGRSEQTNSLSGAAGAKAFPGSGYSREAPAPDLAEHDWCVSARASIIGRVSRGAPPK